MSKRKNYDKSRVIERIVPPRLRELCPNEKFYFKDNTFYFICKLDENTYPDTAVVTKEYYNKPMFEHIGIREIVDIVKKFLKTNMEERDKITNMVEELCQLPDMEINNMINIIEAIFDKYKNILKPICDTYKLCYLLPTTCRTLDIRRYEGKETILNRTDFVIRIVKYTKGDITEEEALRLDVWYNKILPSISPTDTVKKISCIPVKEYDKKLTSDRFINKKGETIKVGRYLRMQKKIEKSING
jgi:hypothetical protein